MPTIAIFFGIVVRMWHDDHPPAHIHAEYQGFEALIAIDTGEVVQGNLPRKVAACRGPIKTDTSIGDF